MPTITAVGVARPSAHGHAIISTAIAVPMAMVIRPAGGPNMTQPANVAAARTRTAGTNQDETRSASLCIGGLAPWASSTSRMIWASAVSRPTAVARKMIDPVRLSVAPITWSPVVLETGRLSPVSMLSSTVVAPSVTTPSTGSFSPGRTRTRSPAITWSMGMSRSVPSRRTRAVLADSPASAVMAAAVRFFARASIHRPIKMSAMTTREVSK